ncbi:MAG: ABC-F family ATP-binding cassette domain-containing protein [Syntrophomonadaceae bacterium]|jgi:ATPase subunit of ABC transporter with duplicated ATPase domains|nr:ABC-F family ATP-binding cassette domain-containing protein [Syntrophomonadaceae bacterium]
MLLLSVDNVAQSFGDKDIFRGVSFQVQKGEKIALVGPNGVGKSSLLRIIAGIDRAQAGQVKLKPGTVCRLMTQQFAVNPGLTVGQWLRQAYTSGPGHRSIDEALKKFSFRQLKEQPLLSLSSGERTRLQLAGLWLAEADLLLLDEPTNHLDMENLQWLQGYINDSPDTIIMVSHDRYFLDQTVHMVFELHPAGITSYPGNYSDYYTARQKKLALDTKLYLHQEKQARKLQEAINLQKQWAGKAHREAKKKARAAGSKAAKVYFRSKAKKLEQRVKNNIKRLERLQQERIARPCQSRVIDLSFTARRRSRNCILLGENLAKSYPGKTLFIDSHISLNHGEKAALIGPNGSGKTTLLRIIAGLEPLDKGSMWYSPSLRVGYLEQEMQSLNLEHSVLQEVATVCSDQQRLRSLLADLLFTGDSVYKPCRVLSMGEQLRVSLAKLLLGTYDLILLDEPSNYMDVDSRHKLEQALIAFGGSLIVVSHDRYLLQQVADQVWVIEEQKITVHPQSYSEYQLSRSIGHRDGTAENRMELEVKRDRLLSELSLIDRNLKESEFLRVEAEYLAVVEQLKKMGQ